MKWGLGPISRRRLFTWDAFFNYEVVGLFLMPVGHTQRGQRHGTNMHTEPESRHRETDIWISLQEMTSHAALKLTVEMCDYRFASCMACNLCTYQLSLTSINWSVRG